MKTNFESVVINLDKINKNFPWNKGYQSFWKSLENNTLDEESFQLLIRDLKYFYSRYIEFFSSVLHRNLRPDIMFPLSANFVQCVNTKLNKVPDVQLKVLPGIESISNLMLMSAETDYYSFFALHHTLNELIFNRKEMDYIFDRNQDTELNKFLFQLRENHHTIKNITKHFNPIDMADVQRILNNNYTLCETIDYWLDEVQTKYDKKMLRLVDYTY